MRVLGILVAVIVALGCAPRKQELVFRLTATDQEGRPIVGARVEVNDLVSPRGWGQLHPFSMSRYDRVAELSTTESGVAETRFYSDGREVWWKARCPGMKNGLVRPAADPHDPVLRATVEIVCRSD